MADESEHTLRFMTEFVGYGSAYASTWFFGPEEAGAKSVNEFHRRVAAWLELGQRPIIDLHEFHTRLGVTQHFTEHAKIQFTWRRLIEIALILEDTEPSTEAIREYQRNKLGRTNGNTLLGELMPLPKPTISSWFYDELSDVIPCLVDLKTYHSTIRPQRIALLQEAISKHKPRHVFFYGVSGKLPLAWQKVANVPLVEVDGDYAVGTNGVTAFVVLKHPNARGMSREYFLEAATMVDVAVKSRRTSK